MSVIIPTFGICTALIRASTIIKTNTSFLLFTRNSAIFCMKYVLLCISSTLLFLLLSLRILPKKRCTKVKFLFLSKKEKDFGNFPKSFPSEHFYRILGKNILNIVPLPTALITSISPLQRVMILFTIDNPIPFPPFCLPSAP